MTSSDAETDFKLIIIIIIIIIIIDRPVYVHVHITILSGFQAEKAKIMQIILQMVKIDKNLHISNRKLVLRRQPVGPCVYPR